ncbi:MazG family protein [Demequina zhanjiangensis]|uniref:MazG family protein n=1 Tax=Demequina zhanjiangensis TaxID=3051659 RepID=A0ABT8G4N7_9MICO|nr:MazG family protein [Demequina sp. SYSU T00b26]MDN4474104.1 MazG family protein [Demequina sp. SYSU T00b26]
MSELTRLLEVMDTLRSDGGCPWDREQTHASLAPYAIEEAFELAESVEAGDREEMRSELGDLLLQVVFHARIAQEHPDDPFDIEDVARGLVDKLIVRHPHVFADVEADDADQVIANWQEIKSQTMNRESVMDGVPVALPALQRAQKILSRAERSELDVPMPQGSDVGSRLLALVAEAAEQGIDAEAALRDAVRAYETTARETERAGARRMEP